MTIEVGQLAPELELPSSRGEAISLSDFRGKHVVLYFYPKDNTPGCTTEACDFRDQHKSFEGLDAVIVGVSPDPIQKHTKFIEKYGLPFILLSDEEHQLAELFDVWKLKKNYGKEYMGIERSTFLFNKESELVKEWRKVKVKDHVEEVLQFIENNLV